jgi:ATP-dependent Clp protease ATP-binding subunit ClpA
MKILEYPLLCQKLNDNAILGQLLGTSKQLVSTDLRSLTGDFAEYIERKLRDGYFYQPEVKDFKLKSYSFTIRPHYQENDRIYPVKENIDVQVYAVYGSSDNGYFECFLPALHKSFYFYTEKDLEKLVEHFSKDAFHDMEPSAIYSMLQQAEPWLESVSVKSPKPVEEKNQSNEPYFGTLPGIAEKLPYTRKESGKISIESAWERGILVEQLINMLLDEKSNVLLVGNSGTGKSTIIQETIRKITGLEKSKERITRHTFWRTSPSRMTAKAKYLGEWQEICEEMVEDLNQNNGILWLENFVMLAMTGGEGPEDSVAAFLTSFIRRRKLQIISEVTPQQLEAMRRLLPGFVEHFQILKVDEMNMTTTLKIFEYFNNHSSRHTGVSFSQKSIEMCYVLLERFIKYESFPGKAIRFLNTCVNKVQLNKKPQIDVNEVIESFSAQTGIPDFLLRDDIILKESELESFFKDRIKGQDHIISKITSIIKIFKAGLNDPAKPIVSMIFAGPTGVGKTATAKALADYFFGIGQSYKPLIRLDMSEFQHPSQIYRLIGTNGKLVQFVREKPFCVVLLDEIEKANPQIFDALLGVLDEGILADSAGKLTDFRNTIIIMTSNLGVSQRKSLGFRNYQDDDFEASIKSFFRPEFYNRIDAVLPFHSLDEKTIKEITINELTDVANRDGIRNRNLKLYFTDELINFMSVSGFDPKYGARPLQREIERLVVAPFARFLLEKPELKNKKITIDFDGNQVVFK